MKFGVDWTSSRHLDTVRRLLEEGKASFCEIMIDNFLHVPPKNLLEAFGSVPITFHIMNSRFIQRDLEELRRLAAQLKNLIQAVKPVYVSDHLALFFHGGRLLPFPMEVDYDAGYPLIKERTAMWQEMLGRRLWLENYPSTLDIGKSQPAFLSSLSSETGAGVLFDFSNAIVAMENCGAPLQDWNNAIAGTNYFHVSGYRHSDTKPSVAIDSHDVDLSGKALAFIQKSSGLIKNKKNCFVVVERDAALGVEMDKDSWGADMDRVRSAFI